MVYVNRVVRLPNKSINQKKSTTEKPTSVESKEVKNKKLNNT